MVKPSGPRSMKILRIKLHKIKARDCKSYDKWKNFSLFSINKATGANFW